MKQVSHRPDTGKESAPPAADPHDDAPPLHFDDPTAVRAWLDRLREQLEDLASAGEDATRPLGQRDLGRRLARRTLLEARRSARHLIRIAERGLG